MGITRKEVVGGTGVDELYGGERCAIGGDAVKIFMMRVKRME